MSTVTIIVGIVVLLSALVSYAFISQAIQQKREQRKRLLAGLKSQARSFRFMLDSCPDGFLTKDLKVIVLKSLVEVTEQLLALEPEVSAHSQELQSYTTMLADTLRSNASERGVQLENAQQMKEVKMSLEALYKFIFKLEEKRKLNRSQADTHRSQIKQLALQVSADSYVLHGNQAAQGGKTKLAVHYFESAINLLSREGKSSQFEGKLAQLREIHAELAQKLAEEEALELPTEDEEAQAELEDEWNKFSSDSDDLWKKKNVYD